VTDHDESGLTRLPEPVTPATLAATVMARVTRLDAARPPAPLATPLPAAASREVRASPWKDVPAWVAALAGVALVFVSWTAGRLEAASWIGLVSSQVVTPSPVRLPPNGPVTVGLAVGVLLYLAGLFAPLRGRD
jgi:hypothetical protein